MNNNFFEVLRPGLNSTYQDRGRFGLQHLGIVSSGCMDHKSFLIANTLLNNDYNEGVIEFAYQGPLLKLIKGKAKISVTGNVYFQIINSNNEIIQGTSNRTYNLKEGDKIDILATKQSVYGYLGIKGGFELEPFWNSVSTSTQASIGPNEGKKFQIKDKVFFRKNNESDTNYAIEVHNKNINIIRVLKGSQFQYFSVNSQKNFFYNKYEVTNLTDRMGMRLKGKFLDNIVSTNIKSEGIIKGSIQIPADGQPIILLNDHPTIGGYPKIANVISADYDLLVQQTPGKKIIFQKIEIKEAEKAFKLYSENIYKTLKNITIIQ